MSQTDPDPVAAANPARVSIIGGGIDHTAHLTWEACKILRAADVVFRQSCHPAVATWLAGFAKQAEVIDLDLGQYQTGMYRPEMYQRMAGRVVEAAAMGRRVVLIETGSACAVDLVTQYTLAAAHAQGLPVEIVPGISTLELVLVTFGVDLASGLQAILAQDLVARQVRLNPEIDSIVFQPGYYDTLWCVGLPQPRPGRFDALREVLALAYAPGSSLAMVRFPMHPGDETHLLWFRLEEWEQIVPVLTPMHTLFIPRTVERRRVPAFQRRLTSWEHTLEFLQRDATGGIPQQLPLASNRELHHRETQLPPDLLARSNARQMEWERDAVGRNLRRLDPVSAAP